MKLLGGIHLFDTIHGKIDSASSRIRGKWLMKYWPELEEYIWGKKYDFVIYQKVYMYKHAELYNGIKILDIVDPDWFTGESIKRMAMCVDAITVSSENLKKFVEGITDKPVIHIPDRHDLEYFKEKKIHKGRAKEVVWYGYGHNAYVIKSVKESLLRFGLNLSIISDIPINVFTNDDRTDCKERWTKWNVDTVNKEIIKSDIVIMPGSTHPLFKYKSNNKTINAYLLNMPVATCIDDLARFLDEEERKKETDKNYELAIDNYDIKQSVEEYKSLIERLKIDKFIGSIKWVFAKTMPSIPHEYIVIEDYPDQKNEIEYFLNKIKNEGYVSRFFGKEYQYLKIDGYKYWVIGNIINRTKYDLPFCIKGNK